MWVVDSCNTSSYKPPNRLYTLLTHGTGCVSIVTLLAISFPAAVSHRNMSYMARFICDLHCWCDSLLKPIWDITNLEHYMSSIPSITSIWTCCLIGPQLKKRDSTIPSLSSNCTHSAQIYEVLWLEEIFCYVLSFYFTYFTAQIW